MKKEKRFSFFSISIHFHSSVSFFFNFCFFLNLFLFLAVLSPHFCARAFSSCSKRGPLFITVRGPLTIAASLVVEHRLQTRRLSNCGSRAQLLCACGIFPDQGSNPCPLHWQADSQPLHHQGSSCKFFLISSVISSLIICCFKMYCLISTSVWIFQFYFCYFLKFKNIAC